MSELRELYQEVILDHNRSPRNFGTLEGANRMAEGHNPLCGDRIRIYLQVEQGRIQDIAFQGSGCAISTASASMMTEAVRGKSVAEAEAAFERFRALLTGPGTTPSDDEMGEMAALAGVRAFPMRVKCATLAWHTLRSALENKRQVATTE